MVLLLDNFDSFTYILKDYIEQLGLKCLVYRNDAISIKELEALPIKSIIISPGPGTPITSGISIQLIGHFYTQKPILGVCLGHQAIGEYFGAELVKAIKPMFGKTSNISFLKENALFKGFESPIEVMRYHSLVLKNVKSPLVVTAKSEEGEVMAIAHKKFPIMGVQFHPESILTENGIQIIRNWFKHINAIHP